MNRQALDDFKRSVCLLDYLQTHHWKPVRQLRRGRWMGLCPLHSEQKPSFLLDADKELFYCYGCGRGGDIIRFAELYHHVRFPQALAMLREWQGNRSLLVDAAEYYRTQLYRHGEALDYLYRRGIHSEELIQHMRVGYAPGGCLRAWLTELGYSLATLRQAGLINHAGHDAYTHRIVFPLEGNLYGRGISAAAAPHRFLPCAKGGLYLFEQVRQCAELILVEGLFDYAALWQAGFRNVTCSLGTHLNARQFGQLSSAARTVYVAFDADVNRSGQQAAHHLAHRLGCESVTVRIVELPDGHDPNSFFADGGEASQFRSLLEAARP
jgi:DNA primase